MAEHKEKMLVTIALDERDLLRKKIIDAVRRLNSVTLKRNSEGDSGSGKTIDRCTVDEFNKKVKSSWQSINDMVKRYRRIVRALTLSNATTMVETPSGKSMTRAEAIAMLQSFRNSGSYGATTDFEGIMIEQLSANFKGASKDCATRNSKVDESAEAMKKQMAGSDRELSKASLELIEARRVAESYELVDPLDVQSLIESLSVEHDALVKELESAVKVSNATTYIEF